MHRPSPAPVRASSDGGGSSSGPDLPEDGLPPRRPRPSALRLLAVAVVSIIVTGLVFRAAVEAVRLLDTP